jgi:hypothetical protein
MWKTAGRAPSLRVLPCHLLEEKARKNLSHGKKNLSQIKENLSQSTVYNSEYNIQYTAYTECNRRNGPNFGRVFLMLNYIEKTQNTYIQS